MDLAEAWSYEAEARGKTGMRLVFKIEELSENKWQLTVEDPKGEVVNTYKGSFSDIQKKLEAFKIQAEKTTRARESK